ncbi:MAG TPA: MFS transporter [Microbacteriaceae bacterium]|nr:MFS transporter [Microbacteriaceae bacterium]
MSVEHRVDTSAGGPGTPGAPTPQIHLVVVFTTVALALMMMSIDSTIVATALHTLQHGLHTSINWAGWTITAYSFGFVVMLPVTGKLSERFGRRKVFLVSVVAFTAASLACGLSVNIFMLIALRAIQAAGGAGFTPSATGIVVDYFGAARDRAVSLFGSIFPIGAMIGPIFGGLFVAYWTWRGVFLINVPVGIAIIALTLRYVPRDRQASADAARREHLPLGVPGMVLLGVGILAGMLAAGTLGEADDSHGVLSPVFLVPALVAIVALVWFFRHISHTAHPFIDPRFIYGRNFGTVNLVNALYSGVRSGAIALLPLYAANRYGIGALSAGTLLIAQGAAAIILSVLAALALRRTGHRPPIYVGSALATLGLVLFALQPIGLSPYWWLAAAAFLIGAGSGASNPASRNAGLQLAPEHSSTLAALRTMSLQIGQIVTIAIVTAVLTGASDPTLTQGWAYLAIAAVFLVCLPIIHRIPEHRGAW